MNITQGGVNGTTIMNSWVIILMGSWTMKMKIPSPFNKAARSSAYSDSSSMASSSSTSSIHCVIILGKYKQLYLDYLLLLSFVVVVVDVVCSLIQSVKS